MSCKWAQLRSPCGPGLRRPELAQPPDRRGELRALTASSLALARGRRHRGANLLRGILYGHHRLDLLVSRLPRPRPGMGHPLAHAPRNAVGSPADGFEHHRS
jgi:hypothetical protein